MYEVNRKKNILTTEKYSLNNKFNQHWMENLTFHITLLYKLCYWFDYMHTDVKYTTWNVIFVSFILDDL
jgi:hypothetical protein